MTEPVVVEVNTKKSPIDAYVFFTEKMHRFWPMNHSIGETARTDMVIEMVEGGRWYEICGEQECDWGRVLDFERGKQVRFAWHLNADWVFDPNLFTEVLVEFTAQGDGTIVRLTHSELDKLGERAETLRESLSSDGGWPEIIGAFAHA